MDPALIAVVCLIFTVLGLAFVVERVWQIIDRWRTRRKERLRWK